MDKMSERHHSSHATEEQLAHLRQKIEAAEAELVNREAELVDLRVELSADPQPGHRLDVEVQRRLGEGEAALRHRNRHPVVVGGLQEALADEEHVIALAANQRHGDFIKVNRVEFAVSG